MHHDHGLSGRRDVEIFLDDLIFGDLVPTGAEKQGFSLSLLGRRAVSEHKDTASMLEADRGIGLANEVGVGQGADAL